MSDGLIKRETLLIVQMQDTSERKTVEVTVSGAFIATMKNRGPQITLLRLTQLRSAIPIHCTTNKC